MTGVVDDRDDGRSRARVPGSGLGSDRRFGVNLAVIGKSAAGRSAPAIADLLHDISESGNPF